MKIPLSLPHSGYEEAEAVSQALKDSDLIFGSSIIEFESKLADKLGQPVISCSSGTAALHLALLSLGIGPGDEVIVTNVSFIATINAILYTGATPVLCDIGDPECLLSMNPYAAKDLITDKTKAILVAHLYGLYGDVETLVEIAKEHKLFLIEDAAQALGCYYEDKALGTFGDVGIISFNGNKIITTAGGGAITSWRSEVLNKASQLMNQAKDRSDSLNYTELGFNYRMSNIQAAIGVAQLGKLDGFIKRKQHLHLRWGQFFDVLKPRPASNFWMTVCRTRCLAVEVYRKLLDLGVETRPLFKPFHQISYTAQYARTDFSVTDRVSDKILCLPSDIEITQDQIQEVIDAIAEMDR